MAISAVGAIVAMGVMPLKGAADIQIQNTSLQSASATISLPIFFGEQSANAINDKPSTTAAGCNLVADKELEMVFKGLAKNWREATGGYSLTMRRYAHPSYQSILALEPKKDVISLILLELQQRPDRWFEALKALTKENPAKDGKTFDETVQCWVEWGKAEKYIS